MQEDCFNFRQNLTMLTDFYEFTMINGYFVKGIGNKIAYFDMFFRKVPDDGGYAIIAGIEQLVEYLKTLQFTREDIDYMRSKAIFDEKFLSYLENFRFECDVWAIREGTPVFPFEPIVTVRGPIIQAQFIETMVLLTINHQSLIATKASRMVRAADGRPIFEFGARRAQGGDGSILGARAAYIGGCKGTACVMADRDFGVPAVGTMAHSWIQAFSCEYDAFKAYADIYPSNCTFLVDTYSVLKSGIPNAIKVSKEVLEPKGYRLKAIRIDSGDIAYLSKKARAMLDDAGLNDVKIMASNSLDEFIIRDLLGQGACIDSFGIGERLITSRSEPVFGGVYKLAAIEGENGEILPKIKISENVEKITTPHFKQVFRLFDKKNDKAIADVVALFDETIDENRPYLLFDPMYTWKKKQVSNFYARPLLEPLFSKGRCVYQKESIDKLQTYCLDQVETLWNEVTRFENPHRYYVDLSKKLWDIKQALLQSY